MCFKYSPTTEITMHAEKSAGINQSDTNQTRTNQKDDSK